MSTFWAIMADQVLFPILGIIVTAILGWLARCWRRKPSIS